MSKQICMDAASHMPKNVNAKNTVYSIDEARAAIAKTIGADSAEIYFTESSSMANAIAVNAAVKASNLKNPHVITTTMEDEATLDACNHVAFGGAEVTYLDPITTGRVEVAMIENEIQANTCLITVTAANPETGTSEPFTGIGTMATAHGILFHTDASYGYGRMPINVKRSHLDMLSASASCFGGPDGIGFLYISKETDAGKYVDEEFIDEAKISEMAAAAVQVTSVVADYMEKMRAIRNHFCERIFAEIEDVELNGHKDHHLVNHLNIRIKNVSAAVVQKELAESDIQVGIGTGSRILGIIGKTKAESAESVRFALTSDVTMEDTDTVVDRLKEIVTGQRVVL